METNSDAQVAHSITQLTTSYHSLMSTSKDLVKRVEREVAEHHGYEQAVADFTEWLHNTREKIEKLAGTPGNNENFETTIATVRVS